MKKAVVSRSSDSEEQKLYRYVQQLGQRLDLLVKQSTDWKELFEAEAVLLRQRLCDTCESLMMTSNHEIARKAEEYVWRRAFYDLIQTMKQDKKALSTDGALCGAYALHLDNAIGFYHHLLTKLKQYYPPLLNLSSSHWHGFSPTTENDMENDKSTAWATKAYQRCLIYLGDLARYLVDINGSYSATLAERYYHQAILACPVNGMPHNQLGTLYLGQDRTLEAAYHYMRCLNSRQSFDGAAENLKRLFDKNRVAFQEISANNNQDGHSERGVFCMGFLHLEEYLFGFNVVQADELTELCQFIVNGCHNLLSSGLNLLLSEQQGSDAIRRSTTAETDLPTPMFMVKLYAMCIMNLSSLKAKGSELATAASTFLMAMISRLLDHTYNCVSIVTKHQPAGTLSHANGYTTDMVGAAQGEMAVPLDHTLEEKKKQVKMTLKKRRRVRRRCKERHNSSTSDCNEALGGSDCSDLYISEDSEDDLSEGDFGNANLSSSFSDSDWDASSDDEEVAVYSAAINDSQLRPGEKKRLEQLTEAATSAARVKSVDGHDDCNGVISGRKSSLSMQCKENEAYCRALCSMSTRGYLAVANAVCTWLSNTPEMLAMCAEKMPTVLQTFADLLNELPTEEMLCVAVASPRKGRCHSHDRADCSLVKKYETSSVRSNLCENIALLGLHGYPSQSQTSGLSQDSCAKVTGQMEAVARVLQLKTTGCTIADNEDIPQFTYDTGQSRFIFSSSGSSKGHNIIHQSPSMPTSLSPRQESPRKKNLMENLARQKLEFELTELESALKSSTVLAATSMSPYLVLDALALCRHLSFIRSLVKSREFIVVVPTVVISALDDLKKFNAGAREAIRFLEEEFKQGNKWLRAQEDHETSNDSVNAANRKKKNRDMEEWRFIQVVLCCAYFAKARQPSENTVTLLTTDLSVSSQRNAQGGMRSSPVALDYCARSGIGVEPVVEFYRRWSTRAVP